MYVAFAFFQRLDTSVHHFRYHIFVIHTPNFHYNFILGDTIIEVFSSDSSCSMYSPLGCNDDFCGYQSRVMVPVIAGRSYFLRVGLYSFVREEAKFSLLVSDTTPPVNNECSWSSNLAIYYGLNGPFNNQVSDSYPNSAAWLAANA